MRISDLINGLVNVNVSTKLGRSLTLDEAAEIVRGVTLQHFPFPLRLFASIVCGASVAGHPTKLVIAAEYELPERDTGVLKTFFYRHEFDESAFATIETTQQMLEVVRACVVEIVAHEVNEALHYDGRRIFETHSNEEHLQAKAEGVVPP